VMGSPDLEGDEKLKKLVEGMHLYKDAGVDFIELNESCPNTAHGPPQDDAVFERLSTIKSEFLDSRTESNKPPVIVKFSNDTDIEQVPLLLGMLFELGFDGVNFGNSSTAYERYASAIAREEKKLYEYYTKTFGGGLTGRPLKQNSLELVRAAATYLREEPPAHEFHVIRAGGVETAADVAQSLKAGASLVQWYTAYFESFSERGHALYQELFANLARITT